MLSRLAAGCAVVMLVMTHAMTGAGAAPSVLPAPRVSPARVHAGSSFAVSGTGCPRSTFLDPTSFDVSVRAPSGQGFGGGGSTNRRGPWRITLRVPAGFPAGTYSVRASCTVDGTRIPYVPGSLTVVAATRPHVDLSSGSIPQGGGIIVHAIGFGARERLLVGLDADPPLAVASADDAGALSVRITVPLGTTTGFHRLSVRGRTSGATASADLTVVAAPGQCGTAACEPPPPLANTGASPARQALVGAGLLALGALLLAAGRCRPRVAVR